MQSDISVMQLHLFMEKVCKILLLGIHCSLNRRRVSLLTIPDSAFLLTVYTAAYFCKTSVYFCDIKMQNFTPNLEKKTDTLL